MRCLLPSKVFWTRRLRMSRGMIQTVGLILILFLSDSHKVGASLEDSDYKSCEHVVKNWASSSVDLEVRNDKHELRDFLFFLHIPRTGGRAYLHCFLKKLYSNSLECLHSYDKLRFNPGQPNCRLISTHDDYSVMSKFPREKTSVVTILRNPLDRVFSTYEFSVEVAARFLIHHNLTSMAKVAEKAFRVFRARPESSVVSTLDIWPWKYLVRWMTEDLFARRDARRLRGLPHSVTNDSYDMDDMVMPLHEYINDPIVQDIVHNGATFQIAGITNNSYSADAHEVRHCVKKYRTLGEYVLEVAKKRLDEMLYVGLTENHKESATGFANAVGAQVISMHMEPNTITDAAIHNDHESEIKGKSPNDNNETDADDQEHNTNVSSTGKVVDWKSMTVGKLLESYENCVPSARRLQSQRRVNALKQISPVNFTKEARKMVSPELLHEIESLNNLDIQLYKYAQSIFAKRRDTIRHDVVTEGLGSTLSTDIHPGLYDSLSSNLLFLCIGCLTSVLILVYVKSWRKVSKVKL